MMRHWIGTAFGLAVVIAMASPVLAATPVAYWRLDNDGKIAGQTAGTIVDSVGSNTGSGVSGPTYSSDVFGTPVPITGAPNALSIDLDRVALQYLSVPHHASISFGASAYTIEAFVKVGILGNPLVATTRGYLVQKKGTGALMDDDQDYAFLVQLADRGSIANTPLGKQSGFTGRELAYHWGDGTLQHLIVSNLAIDDTTSWHHVSVAFDGSNTLRFEVDGVFETITGLSSYGHFTNAGELIIGGKTKGNGQIGEVYDGRIDELRIHSGFAAPGELLLPNAVPMVPVAGLLALGGALVALGARASFRRRRPLG